jgi:hypothetical protein
MIIGYFDIVRIPLLPSKADSPLIVDPDAVLSQTIFSQLFKSVGRRDLEIIERYGRIDHQQFPKRGPLDVRRQPP